MRKKDGKNIKKAINKLNYLEKELIFYFPQEIIDEFNKLK